MMTIPKNWKKVPIKEVYSGFWDGPHATPKPADEGPIFLGIKNITADGRLVFSEIRHIAEKDFPRWTRRVRPQPGDIVFSYEATLHRYAIIPEGFRGCLGRRLALIRPDPAKVDSRFLFYYFFAEEWRKTVAKHLIFGSTVDRIPLLEFPEFEIHLPPLATQRKVAGILSAYDDLIENNSRRIQILEEIAQAIYREWFAEFRFPGHENVTMVSVDSQHAGSGQNEIPEKWQFLPFSKIADFVNGYAFKPRVWSSEGLPIVKIAELKNGVTLKTPFNSGETIPQKYHIESGDILFSWSADLDAYIWAHGSALLNQHLFNVIPQDGYSKYFLYHSLKMHMPEFRAKSLGTTMRHIKRSALDQVKCRIPPTNLRLLFDENIEPLAELIINLNNKNGVLKQKRDLLLPKLISGQLYIGEMKSLAGLTK